MISISSSRACWTLLTQAHTMKPWAEDLGYSGQAFAWNEDRRAQVRAELDAFFAKKYGLTEEELRYVLDPGQG